MQQPTEERTPAAASQFRQASPSRRNIPTGSLAPNEDYYPVAINGPVQRGRRPQRPTNLRLQERLLSVLPRPEATNLLVDTYFDRAHWFMLVFHQQEFRQQLQQLQNEPHRFQDGNRSASGFLAVLLTVICIGLQYLGEYRETLLATYGINRQALQNEIIAALENSFLAIVSLESLEAVQSCVLLGTFYLYHSDSATAWSICGCALRIAQAIKLHRSWPVSDGRPSPRPNGTLRQIEARRRCWWALYEVETFCCMLYGYNCNILDEDCDMDFLTGQKEASTGGDSVARPPPTFTLLSYKENMSKLSVILKSALSALYGQWTGPRNAPRQDVRLGDMQQELFSSIEDLNRRLNQWHTKLPSELKTRTPNESGYENVEDSERDVGGCGQAFDSNIVQLQALALELAYENAKILVNRPLFTEKLNRRSAQVCHNETTDGRDLEVSNTFQESFRICREAALRTAEIGDYPAFKFAFRSFAAAFMSTHLFTAGVTLCLSAIAEPLTEHATQAKVGLQKLFNLQNDPISEPLASPHVTIVLERLIRMILERELFSILGPRRQIALKPGATQQPSPITHVNDFNDDNSEADHPNPAISRSSRSQPLNTNVSETLNTTRSCKTTTSEAVAHGGHSITNDVVQDHPNGNFNRPHWRSEQTNPSTVTPSLLSAQGQFDISDDSFLMANDPLFTDQEQAWIWNMDPWPQL